MRIWKSAGIFGAYNTYLSKCPYQDSYHKTLIYCLGLSEDTRRNVNRIYDFETGFIKPECLQEGWQTSGSERIVRLAFNLYTDGTPTTDEYDDTEEQITETRLYSVSDIFCTGDAKYFWENGDTKIEYHVSFEMAQKWGRASIWMP